MSSNNTQKPIEDLILLKVKYSNQLDSILKKLEDTKIKINILKLKDKGFKVNESKDKNIYDLTFVSKTAIMGWTFNSKKMASVFDCLNANPKPHYTYFKK